MNNKQQLHIEQEKIKTEIDSVALGINCQKFIIYDGIANIDLYISSSIPIMFLLKESYETKGKYLWQVGIIYNKKAVRKYPTLRRVGYISTGILNEMLFEDVSKQSNEILAHNIESAAWVNINKIAAKSKSDVNLSEKYKIWNEIIIKQILAYKSKIILCGNTLQYLKNDPRYINDFIKISTPESKKYIKSAYVFKQKLFIQMIHPGKVLSLDNEKEFINSVVNYSLEWIKNLNLTTAST